MFKALKKLLRPKPTPMSPEYDWRDQSRPPMDAPELVSRCPRLAPSFIEAVREDEVTYPKGQAEKFEALGYEIWEDEPDNPRKCYWLVDRGEVVGDVKISTKFIRLDDDSNSHIDYWIRPSRRGLGYGAVLFQQTLIRCKELGFEKVRVKVKLDNEPSIKIIERAGGKYIDQWSGHRWYDFYL